MVCLISLLDSLNACSCGYSMKTADEFCSSCGKKRFKLHDLPEESKTIKQNMIEEDTAHSMEKTNISSLKRDWYHNMRFNS